MSAPTTVVWRGDAFENEMRLEIRDLMTQLAHIFRREISQVLSRGKSPPASKAGQPPRQASGNLAGSWMSTLEIPHSMRGVYTAKVFTNVKYARALEFGYAPRNLKPRPYVLLGMEMAAPHMRNMINANKMVERAIARLGII